MKQVLLALLFTSVLSPALAQIVPATPAHNVHSDTTRYRGALQQDPVYVFLNRQGQLKAHLPDSTPALFVWQKLDTAATAVDLFTTWKCDTQAPHVESTTPDTLGWGYYRVLVDTLDTHGQRLPADTLHAWVMVDSFAVDTIRVTLGTTCDYPILNAWLYPNEQDRNFGYPYYDLRMSQGIKIPKHLIEPVSKHIKLDAELNGCLQVSAYDTLIWEVTCERQVHYLRNRITTALGLNTDEIGMITWQKQATLYMPEGKKDYIKTVAQEGVKWTPSTDIHAGAKGLETDDSWRNRIYSVYVPRPLHNATYKLEVQNYFGNQATATTDTIFALNTYAMMNLTTGRGPEGNVQWSTSPETDDKKEHDSPLWIKLQSQSINASEGSEFEWVSYESETERDTTLVPPVRTLRWDITSVSPEEQVVSPWAYLPGIYPVELRVRNQHGCLDTARVMVHVREFLISEDNFTTVLSPNSQKGNTHFKIKNLDEVHSVTSFEVKVVNRWNQLMFSSNNLAFEWDGKMRGSNSYAADGVYFFVVRAEGHNMKGKKLQQTIKGNVHVFTGK